MSKAKIEAWKDTVTIPRKEYDELCKAEAMLDALHAAGVDNWEGYQLACGDADYE